MRGSEEHSQTPALLTLTLTLTFVSNVMMLTMIMVIAVAASFSIWSSSSPAADYKRRREDLPDVVENCDHKYLLGKIKGVFLHWASP